MVNSIWAVACTVLAVVGLFAVGSGCTASNSQLMDMGPTPGATLRQLTELQKDDGSQRSPTNLEHETSSKASSGSLATGDSTSPSTASNVSSQPSPAPSGNVSAQAAIPDDVSPSKQSEQEIQPKLVKHSEPANKEVSKSNFIPQLDEIAKKPTDTKSLASPSESTTDGPLGAKEKPVAETKIASSPSLPATISSKSDPPSGNTKPLEKEVPPQASVGGQNPAAKPLPPSTAGKAESSVDSQYRLGPEDILHVSVWGNEQLTMDVVVRPDGKISVPLIQDIQAEGFTAAELADRIHQGLLPYIKDPNVSVIVKQINAPKFSVMGYVNRPGTFPMRGDVTILQALSEAGGFTPFASPGKIKLVRNASGKQEIRVVDYYDIIEQGGKGNFLLMPGDAIVVP